MGIKYYPNRVFRALPTPVDAITKKDTVKTFRGVADITSVAISEVLTPYKDWKIVGIKFSFNNATSRSFSASIIGGRSIIENLNDFLWFQVPQTLPVKITLDPGFYTGTELATELKTQMDANSAFSALAITFTVTYNATTGEYTITPSSGTLKYLEFNQSGTLPNQYSIAGHLFGFNVNAGFSASLTSDTPVPGLNSEIAVINQTTNTDLSLYNSDLHTLSLDEAILIESNTAATIVNYSVDYQEILT